MSHRSLLARATEGTDAPTPGYLYVDLAKACSANPNAAADAATYLSRRLASKQNPHIKHKCLKVLAKLCDAVPHLRRCVAQDHTAVAAVKEAMHFRGTPDPVRGDEPNQKVRIAAKEALDAVYRETPSSEYSNNNSRNAGGGVSHSYGGNGHASNSNNGSSSNNSRMQGIGNPMFQDPRNDPRYNGEGHTGVVGAVKEAGEVLAGMIKDPLARNVGNPHQQQSGVPHQGHSGNLPGYGGPSYGRPPPGSAELSRSTNGQWTMASNRGPGAVGQPDYQREAQQQQTPQYGGNNNNRLGSVGGSWGSSQVIRPSSHSTPSITVNSIPGSSAGGGGGAAVSDGTYEKNLVLELCPPGGMKPVPPPDKLANFARHVGSLNSDLVAPVLLDCLEDGQPWIIRAKALCAMETSIANGAAPDGRNPYRDFFFACQAEIAPLAQHPRSAIHDPAKRVMALLGVSAASAAAPPIAAAPVAAAPNLLDFGDDVGDRTAPAAAPPNMFGGMTVKQGAAAEAAPAVTVATPEAPPNLLDLDATGAVPVPAATAPPAATPPAAQATVMGASSMFDQLSVKESAGPSVAAAEEAPAAPTASAFGFMNNDSGSGSTPATSDAPPPPSFDPLHSSNHSSTLTPNSARRAMQLSPDQLQAMQYQSMRMQQQQHQQLFHMHQMQLMAMQNGGVPGAAGVNAGVGSGVVGGLPMGMPMYAPGGPRMVGRTSSSGSANGMGSGGGGPAGGMQNFSFGATTRPAAQDDKKFDFVMDHMKTAGKK